MARITLTLTGIQGLKSLWADNRYIFLMGIPKTLKIKAKHC